MRRLVGKFLILAALVALRTDSALACAACYGRSDSALAQGMNWGIFSLLAVVVTVLGGIASFFVYLAKKSAAISALAASGELPSSTDKN